MLVQLTVMVGYITNRKMECIRMYLKQKNTIKMKFFFILVFKLTYPLSPILYKNSLNMFVLVNFQWTQGIY